MFLSYYSYFKSSARSVSVDLERVSAIKSYSPGLYEKCTAYFWIDKIIHWRCAGVA